MPAPRRIQACFLQQPVSPSPQSQSLSPSYGSNLPTSLTYIVLSTRGSVGRASFLSHAVRQWHSWSKTWAQPMLVCMQVCGLKWHGHSSGHQEVNRCCTRSESEKSVACQQWSTPVKKSTFALKPRTDITRRLNKRYQWLHRKDWYPPDFFSKTKQGS